MGNLVQKSMNITSKMKMEIDFLNDNLDRALDGVKFFKRQASSYQAHLGKKKKEIRLLNQEIVNLVTVNDGLNKTIDRQATRIDKLRFDLAAVNVERETVERKFRNICQALDQANVVNAKTNTKLVDLQFESDKFRFENESLRDDMKFLKMAITVISALYFGTIVAVGFGIV